LGIQYILIVDHENVDKSHCHTHIDCQKRNTQSIISLWYCNDYNEILPDVSANGVHLYDFDAASKWMMLYRPYKAKS